MTSYIFPLLEPPLQNFPNHMQVYIIKLIYILSVNTIFRVAPIETVTISEAGSINNSSLTHAHKKNDEISS